MFGRASITIVAVWLAVLASGLTAVADGSNDLTIDIASVDDSQFPSLSAVVNVLDAKARPVAGLDTASFRATIDGEPATVEGLQTAVDSQVSLAVVLAVDVSGSMSGEPLAAAQTAATEFVRGLSPQDTAAVLTFGDSVNVVQDSSPDQAAVIGALEGLQAVGDTALFDATSRATAKALESPSPRKVIILLSDGVDYGGKSIVTRDESIAQARAAGVPIYTIGLGEDVDKAYLNELAQATDARFLETPTPQGLSQLYADIAGVLRGQYIVSLQSSGVDRSAPHTLELSVTVGAVTAVAAKSLAPAVDQPPQVSVKGLLSHQEVKSATTITAEVSGSAPVEVQFLVDGKPVSRATAAPYQASLDPAALEGGNHSLRIEARDAAGRIGSLDVSFVVPAGGTGGATGTPLLAALLALVVAASGLYVLLRRRPRMKRQVVQVRLRPWSNGGAAIAGLSLADDEPLPTPSPEPAEEPVAKLVMVGGPNAGQEFPVGMKPVSIGAADWCGIALSDKDGRIGPEEARAWVHQDKLIFHKLTRLSILASEGATGGWLILEHGDEIAVGPHRMRFETVAQTTSAEAMINKAVNEAVQHLATDSADGGLGPPPAGSRLWPVDVPPADSCGEEDSSPPAAASA